VQAAINGVISTGLRPADRYAFTDTNCASPGVTDFCETNFEIKTFESMCVCVCVCVCLCVSAAGHTKL
jgi:hypothetical protein